MNRPDAHKLSDEDFKLRRGTFAHDHRANIHGINGLADLYQKHFDPDTLELFKYLHGTQPNYYIAEQASKLIAVEDRFKDKFTNVSNRDERNRLLEDYREDLSIEQKELIKRSKRIQKFITLNKSRASKGDLKKQEQMNKISDFFDTSIKTEKTTFSMQNAPMTLKQKMRRMNINRRLENYAKKNGIEYKPLNAGNVRLVSVNPEIFDRGLGNLVNNAKRHMAPNDKMTLKLVGKRGEYQIKLSNTGSELGPEAQEKLGLEEFTTKTKSGEHGKGTLSVAQMAKEHWDIAGRKAPKRVLIAKNWDSGAGKKGVEMTIRLPAPHLNAPAARKTHKIKPQKGGIKKRPLRSAKPRRRK